MVVEGIVVWSPTHMKALSEPLLIMHLKLKLLLTVDPIIEVLNN
jgi:hypothetical protein